MGETYERGRFYIGPNGFPRFAGSASGVYFADTVQTEIGPSPHDQSSTGIEEAFIGRTNNDEPRAAEAHFYSQYLRQTADLKHGEALRSRLTTYFATWHPLFPFLDGAYLLQCFNSAVTMADHTEGAASRQAFEGLKEEEALVLSAIMMAVFSIGGGKSDQQLPLLRGTSHATMLAHLILGAVQNSSINDLFAIQGLVAIELYLFTTRTLRPAMHLSGTITTYEAGLHRCPNRFATTFKSAPDRELRRRVFYTLYVLDRLLSAEFGIPLMLNDNDVDTCVPGAKERHDPAETPPDHPARTPVSPRASKKRKIDEAETPSAEDETARRRLLPAFSLATIAGIMGRAMEVFNKSVNHRSTIGPEALHLRTELESWWNDIGLDLEDESSNFDPRKNFSTLFTCLYHQQRISLHRSALSLSPSTSEHAYALQSAIASARSICATLAKAFLGGAVGECLWPGYVDMVFFSCLILVYGDRRERAMGLGSAGLQRDLQRALQILDVFSVRWGNLRSFIRVINTLIKSAEDPGTAKVSPPSASTSAVPAQALVPFNPLMPFFPPNDPTSADLPSDFVFDFDGLFELNPDTLWAFHQSLPGSPILPGT